MRSLFFAGMLLLITGFYSCSRCDMLDCLYSNYYFTFRVVDRVQHNDLLFGTNALYDPAKIQFYTLNGTDTSFFDAVSEKYAGTGFDSVLTAGFFPETTLPVYMKLNESDTDTLAIAYKTYKTQCCGIITEITNIRVNNTVDLPVGYGPQSISK